MFKHFLPASAWHATKLFFRGRARKSRPRRPWSGCIGVALSPELRRRQPHDVGDRRLVPLAHELIEQLPENSPGRGPHPPPVGQSRRNLFALNGAISGGWTSYVLLLSRLSCPLGVGRFKAEHPVTKLQGDHDIFGDGSATIISTPGHTPGHQSLLVKLPRTGAIVLSGDAVHFRSNWENRGVPANNTDKERTLASMQCIADVMAKENAQLWINHDKAQRDSLKMSPGFYD
jgi:glyoxylase-like metal-dependent hydrolase (beta-lactamase superfamily II)